MFDSIRNAILKKLDGITVPGWAKPILNGMLWILTAGKEAGLYKAPHDPGAN